MNNLKRINKFSAVLKSKKFKNDLHEARVLLKDLHTFDILVNDFTWFLTAYPLSEKKKKIFCKLDGKKKFGMLSRHLASVSSKLGISQIFLENFYELKEREGMALKSLKGEDWKYHYSFLDEDRTLRDSETTYQQADIAVREAEIKERRQILSRMLLRQTMDLIDFCLDKYDAREDKINQLLEEND